MRNYSWNEARTLRPNEIRLRWNNLQKNNDQLKQLIIQKTQEISADPTAFFEQIIGLKPYEYQKEFIEIFQNNQFTAAVLPILRLHSFKHVLRRKKNPTPPKHAT
jgi:hypothetical protein